MLKPPKIKKIIPTKVDYKFGDDKGYLPSFELTEKQLSVIKDWKIGEKYCLLVEVIQKSSRIKHVEKSDIVCSEFEIVGVNECK